MEIKQILKRLKLHASQENVTGMARFGISTKNTLGVSMPILRRMGKEIGKNHALALELWQSGIHEARILAGLIAEPAKMTPRQMDAWVKDFDSWDVCDQVCMNLFDKTAFAWQKAKVWTNRKEEFVRRAGFALIASLACHDKKANDEKFIALFPLMKKAACDERNYVKKAVNLALRQIGKRNPALRKEAIKAAREIQKMNSRSARWIAADAIRELRSRK